MMSAATFRTPGNVTTRQTLFALYNAGSARIVRVRRVVLQSDTTGAMVALMPIVKLCRIASYSGGEQLTKVPWTATASHADVEVRGRNTSDGGSQTDIVATIGDTLWQQFSSRFHAPGGGGLAGQVIGDDQNMAPMAILSDPIVLRSGQGLLVYVEAPAGTTNPNSRHYFVQAAWTEDAT
jgi:hypothetical protein